MLAGKERGMPTAVPTEGSSGKFGVDRCSGFIAEDRDRDNNVVVEADHEPSLEYLIKGLIEHIVERMERRYQTNRQ